MKIILSRKGIDGGNGGMASPLIRQLNNRWVPVSIPIGGGADGRPYNQITARGFNLKDLACSLGVRNLNNKPVTASSRAHFDPDLDSNSVKRKSGWLPMFGQWSKALRHLENQHVTRGDLFLFFGRFKRAELNDKQTAHFCDTHDIHSFFGWLQVGECWDVNESSTEELRKTYSDWAWEHPHFSGPSSDGYGTIYVAPHRLTISGRKYDLSGGGVFKHFSDTAQLTWPQERKHSIWKLPRFFHGSENAYLSYHGKEWRWTDCKDSWQLQSVARGQEFVFDLENLKKPEQQAALDWALNLIKAHI